MVIAALADWHHSDHGDRCVCLEGERFGFQAAAIVDALMASGVEFEWLKAPKGPHLGGGD